MGEAPLPGLVSTQVRGQGDPEEGFQVESALGEGWLERNHSRCLTKERFISSFGKTQVPDETDKPDS